jgi:hypothetical protein
VPLSPPSPFEGTVRVDRISRSCAASPWPTRLPDAKAVAVEQSTTTARTAGGQNAAFTYSPASLDHPSLAGRRSAALNHRWRPALRRTRPDPSRRPDSSDNLFVMSALLEELPTLIGVVVGALLSYGAAALTARTNWRRAQATRWDERRLQACADYGAALKAETSLCLRMAAALKLAKPGPRITSATTTHSTSIPASRFSEKREPAVQSYLRTSYCLAILP